MLKNMNTQEHKPILQEHKLDHKNIKMQTKKIKS